MRPETAQTVAPPPPRMHNEGLVHLKVLDSIASIPREAWDALLDEEATPFVRWDFLEALETTRCATPRSGWVPRQTAQLARSLQVPIYTIDAGGDSEESSGSRQKAKATLEELATMTRGRAFEARDTAGLLAACKEIDRLEREKIQSFQYRRYHEGFTWFGLAAFVLLVAVNVLELTWWQRLP